MQHESSYRFTCKAENSADIRTMGEPSSIQVMGKYSGGRGRDRGRGEGGRGLGPGAGTRGRGQEPGAGAGGRGPGAGGRGPGAGTGGTIAL